MCAPPLKLNEIYMPFLCEVFCLVSVKEDSINLRKGENQI